MKCYRVMLPRRVFSRLSLSLSLAVAAAIPKNAKYIYIIRYLCAALCLFLSPSNAVQISFSLAPWLCAGVHGDVYFQC